MENQRTTLPSAVSQLTPRCESGVWRHGDHPDHQEQLLDCDLKSATAGSDLAIQPAMG